MIPIDFMDDEVAYQTACDQGFDPRDYLEMEIEGRQGSLHEEVVAIEDDSDLIFYHE